MFFIAHRVVWPSVCDGTQLQQEEDHGIIICSSSSGLTLRRLNVWMCEPLARLKTLAALVDVCSGNDTCLIVVLLCYVM